jgi:hypothetical protein
MSEGIHPVKEYLTAVAEMRQRCVSKPKEFRFNGIEDLLLKHGKGFAPPKTSRLPAGVKRGPMKHCFENAGDIAVFGGTNLTYCEGYACGVIPVLHAWLVKPDGQVVDPTWRDGKCYFGVPIMRSYLVSTITRTGWWGVLENWREDFPMLREDPAGWLAQLDG